MQTKRTKNDDDGSRSVKNRCENTCVSHEWVAIMSQRDWEALAHTHFGLNDFRPSFRPNHKRSG